MLVKIVWVTKRCARAVLLIKIKLSASPLKNLRIALTTHGSQYVLTEEWYAKISIRAERFSKMPLLFISLKLQ